MAQVGTAMGDSAHADSIKVTLRTDRSSLMWTAQHLLKPFKSKLLGTLPTGMPAGSPKLTPEKSALKVCDVEERMVDDIYVYDFKSKDKLFAKSHRAHLDSYSKRIYYFAGGGWRAPPNGEHWKVVSKIACSVPDAAVSLVSYPLAPHSPAPDAFPQLIKLYHTILQEAEEASEKVIFVGDSAGGNIILAITLYALKMDLECRCPSVLLAIAPSTDLGRGNPDINKIAPHDPLLQIGFIQSTAAGWCGKWDVHDDRVSPLFGDVSSLARRGIKVHGITGGYDILSPDGILFREKCRDAGVSGEWLHWEKQMHCFFLAFPYKLRESVEAMDWIIRILNQS